MTNRFLARTVLLFATVSTAACASSGALASLDDLTAQVDPSGIFESLPQQRVLSLSGMVPSGEPGRVFKFHANRSPFTAFGISKHVHGYASCSEPKPLSNRCEEPCDDDCVAPCHALAATTPENDTDSERATNPEALPATPATERANAEGACCTTCERATKATESYYLRRRIPYLPVGTTGDESAHLSALRAEAYDGTREQGNAFRTAYEAACKLPVQTPPELIALRDLLNRVRLKASEVVRLRLDAVSAEHQVVTTNDRAVADAAADAASSAMTEFERLLQEATEAVSRPGLMVARYSFKQETSLAAKIGSIFGVDADASYEKSGFIVLAGLEFATLYLGTDFKAWATTPGRDWSLIGTRFPYLLGSEWPYIGQWSVDNVQVITSRLAADHVIFGSDSLTESRIKANVEAAADQLENLGGTLSEIDKIEIEGVLTSVESLGNNGVLGTMFQEAVPYCKWSQLRGEAPQDVYVVMTDYDDLIRFADSESRYHLTRFW